MINKVKMIIDRNQLTASFECDGDVWAWIKKAKNRNSNHANMILNDIRDNEIHTFRYEMYLDKFIKQYESKVDEVVIRTERAAR